MSRHITLIAGHGAGDPGAVNRNVNPIARCDERIRVFVHLLAGHIRSMGRQCTVYPVQLNCFRETQAGRGMWHIPNSHEILEFHMNGFHDQSAHGAEVLAHSTGNAIDNRMLTAMGRHFRNRGLKVRRDLLNINVAHQRSLPFRMVEVGFITNNSDLHIFNRSMDAIARDLATAIVGTVPPPQPTFPQWEVAVASLNRRRSPGTSGQVVDSVGRGHRFRVVETRTANGHDWGRDASNDLWLALTYCRLVPTNVVTYEVIAPEGVNRRRTPGLNGVIVPPGAVRGHRFRVSEFANADGHRWGRDLANGLWVALTNCRRVV